MKIQTKILKSALANLRPIFGGKYNSMIYAGHVKLQNGGGCLTMTATNLDEWQVERVNIDGTCNDCCVNFKHLEAAIGGDEMEFAIEGNKLKITYGKSVYKLGILDAAEFPALPSQSEHVAQGVNAASLASGIRSVLPFVETKVEQRPALGCVHVVASDARLMVEATDGRYAARYLDQILSGVFEMVVPREFAGKIADSLCRPDSQIRLSENSAIVEHNEGWYQCKLAETNYPNTERVWETLGDELGEIETGKVIPFLQARVSMTPPDFAASVEMQFDALGLKVSSPDGDLKDEFDGSFSPYSVPLDAARVLAIFKSLKADKLQVNKAERGIVFQDARTAVLINRMVDSK